MKASGPVNRVELECQVLCAALRQSWVRHDKVGAFTSIRELSHLFPDLLPPPEDKNGTNKSNYYDVLSVRPQSGLNSIMVGYLRRVRNFLKEKNPKDNRVEFNTILNGGFVLRKPRLRLSHDLVVARRWLYDTSDASVRADTMEVQLPPDLIASAQQPPPVPAVQPPVVPPPVPIAQAQLEPQVVQQPPPIPQTVQQPPPLPQNVEPPPLPKNVQSPVPQPHIHPPLPNVIQQAIDPTPATPSAPVQPPPMPQVIQQAIDAPQQPPVQVPPLPQVIQQAMDTPAPSTPAQPPPLPPVIQQAIESPTEPPRVHPPASTPAGNETIEYVQPVIRPIEQTQPPADRLPPPLPPVEIPAVPPPVEVPSVVSPVEIPVAQPAEVLSVVPPVVNQPVEVQPPRPELPPVLETSPAHRSSIDDILRAVEPVVRAEFVFDESKLRKPEAKIDLPPLIKLMEAAHLITGVEVQALKAQIQLAPNIAAEQLVMNAGYATKQEISSLHLAQDLLARGRITMAQFQVAMYDERTSGLRMAESLQVRGWLETQVKNTLEG